MHMSIARVVQFPCLLAPATSAPPFVLHRTPNVYHPCLIPTNLSSPSPIMSGFNYLVVALASIGACLASIEQRQSSTNCSVLELVIGESS